MLIETIQEWSRNLPYLIFPILIVLSFLLYRGTKFVLARLSYWIALRTESTYDDLFVDRLQPFRFAWLVPLLLIFFYSDEFLSDSVFVQKLTLTLSIWFVADFVIAILSGINDVYSNHPRYSGVSVAGYTGLLQVLTVVAAIVLSISYLTDIGVSALISGAGAWLAVLLLIFRDTILSFLASIQIFTQKLVKAGDLVDIPAFGASGTVKEINLQTITVQNFDNTLTSIPTSKLVETGFKNYRIMLERGTWRMKRSILLDVNSIKFLDASLLDKMSNTDFINAQINDSLIDEDTHATNLQLFIQYALNYIKTKKAVRLRRYPFLIRTLEHSPKGLPVEIYIFVKVPTWEKFEEFQAEIMIHLFATLPYFDLISFQDD